MMKVVFLVMLSFYEHFSLAEELHFQPGATEPEALIQKAWAQFKTQYEKIYSSVEEESHRKQIFFDSLKIIESHNHLYETGRSTYNMGINQFSDMEFSEVIQMMGLMESNVSYIGEEEGLSSVVDDSIPRSVDWRKRGYVTPVKNQGPCGSCWAFSATGSLEGQTKKKTGRLVSLSEQNLIDCSTPQGNHGCNGGWMNYAFEYIRINGGIDTEMCYPYEARDGPCRYKPQCRGATVTGYVDIKPAGSEYSLTKAIAIVGPISVAINVQDSFRHYKSGVYQDSNCDAKTLNHAVLAVGYGIEMGQAYYIVKNSWGAIWGDKGYILMARNRGNMCGIASRASYPRV